MLLGCIFTKKSGGHVWKECFCLGTKHSASGRTVWQRYCFGCWVWTCCMTVLKEWGSTACSKTFVILSSAARSIETSWDREAESCFLLIPAAWSWWENYNISTYFFYNCAWLSSASMLTLTAHWGGLNCSDIWGTPNQISLTLMSVIYSPSTSCGEPLTLLIRFVIW